MVLLNMPYISFVIAIYGKGV